MRKIPTVFRRGEHNRRYVTPVVMHRCEWVLAGEGVPTRKYDGTCCMFDGTAWWARREVKPGKQTPPNFVAIEHDEQTDKTVGWEPMEQSPFARWHADALAAESRYEGGFPSGTYELCGPKVNNNPERFDDHCLIHHATEADGIDTREFEPLSFGSIRSLVLTLGDEGLEGIVWHHPDGRMAKVKVRDFEQAAEPDEGEGPGA